jgi:hypothetical protein
MRSSALSASGLVMIRVVHSSEARSVGCECRLRRSGQAVRPTRSDATITLRKCTRGTQPEGPRPAWSCAGRDESPCLFALKRRARLHDDPKATRLQIRRLRRRKKVIVHRRSQLPYGSNPNAVTCVGVTTNTFPFATSGMLNFVANPNVSRDPAWSLLYISLARLFAS